ncbi:carboxylate-amine ligase [Asanoa siamensis]|uniref:Putative glutamate--cysteine ligase 2 n=1 Tax=Asanoa siamensis TaxID=926357 RepID=A0ABQ4D3N9_9ACTN|nr:glutamate--cysteine ligase [Asanoa siamensis]GIF78149.1 putative glutamate--cysteine ligase 2-3 [Asanoa siamensis]
MVPTLGVEEEYLLLDPVTGHNVPVADEVYAALPEEVAGQSRREFRRSMVEMVTPVCRTLAEVRQSLFTLRVAAAKAAATAGARLVAVGATPIADPDRTVSDDPRFRRIVDHYGPVVAHPAVCGCHVHVGVPDRDVAIQVGNHLRVWLPVVQAIAVNSPLHAGADTGHASWRAMQLDRWPSLGPTPWFASTEDYDRTVRALVASGVMLDETMVLWHARPSARYPTVEVRVTDVCLTIDDAVLVAGLVRALVATAIDDIAAGRPAPRARGELVRAAHWNAAHTGLTGTLTDPRTGGSRPAFELVDELVATVRPALDRHGDLTPALQGLDALRERGTGADWQRRVHARTRDVAAMLADLGQRTIEG